MNSPSKQACKAKNISCVYICALSDCARVQAVENRKLQRRLARQLLDFAYFDVFGESLQKQSLHRQPSGKPVCDKCYLSVAHSGNCVAVALSESPVGVDLQKCTNVNMRGIACKFFTEEEQSALEKAQDFSDGFYFTWCKKEALWKSLNNQPPTVAAVDTTKRQFTQQKLQFDGETYYLAVTDLATVKTVSAETVTKHTTA